MARADRRVVLTMSITWSKARSGARWIGSVGHSYPEVEAYTINKVKPPTAPRPRLARITGREWHYEYVLFTRMNGDGFVHRVGTRYTTIAAAQAAAAAHLASR